MGSPRTPRSSIVVIRVQVGRTFEPTIRILSLADLHRPEHVLLVTTSPDEAAALVARWLRGVLRGQGRDA